MINLVDATSEVLLQAGFSTKQISVGERPALVFENLTVLGFVLVYEDVNSLVRKWEEDSDSIISTSQLALRRAGQKAWNAYVVLLTKGAASYAQSVSMGAIEEDLAGTRKIAKSGIGDASDIHAALLPLLELRAAPRLESVDMRQEIRQRTTELSSRVVDAFLSSVDDSVVVSVLEEDA